MRLGHHLARGIVQAAALLVPRPHRGEWRAEWMAELVALRDHPRGHPGRPGDYPSPVPFALGALPHAWDVRRRHAPQRAAAADLRIALRSYTRRPGFALMVVLTLALGIGATGAVYSVVDGLLFRPAAGVEDPGRLVQIARSYDQDPRWDSWSWPAYRLLAAESRTLSEVAGSQRSTVVLGRGTDAVSIPAEMVTGTYFGLLGVRPHLGRLLGPSDDLRPGEHAVLVLSHRLWVRRYGADPGIVGRTVALGAQPHEVVGVAPPAFVGLETLARRPEVWLPTMQHPGWYGQLPFEEWGSSWIDLVGRMAEGATLAEVRTEASLLSTRLRAAWEGHEGIRVLVAGSPGMSPEDRREARRASWLLLGIVLTVLLLACSNVTNLFLARHEARRQELAIRGALGAGRRRIVALLVRECLLLAGVATVLALALLHGASGLLPSLVPYPVSISLAPDGAVWLLTVVTGLGAGLLCGAIPAWLRVQGEGQRLMPGPRERGSVRFGRLRDGLVVLQLGMSVALVASAALLGRSLANARTAQPGFEPAGLAAAFVDVEGTGRYEDQADGLELMERVRAEALDDPRLQAVAVADQAPIVGGHSRATVRPADRPDHPGFEAERILVGDGYFETLGIPLLEGRSFRPEDDGGEPVAVVNRALAERFWPGESAMGRRLEGTPGRRVVGVVGNVQMRTLRRAGNPGVYLPLAQVYRGRMVLHGRGGVAAPHIRQALVEAVGRTDPELPVSSAVSFPAALAESMGETRTVARLVTVFGALALLLAALGLYGLVSFTVSRRMREMGIRKALGAPSASLVRLVVRHGMWLGVLGIGVGMVFAWMANRGLARLLYGIDAGNPVVLGLTAATLLGTVLFASWIPARRAGRVDAGVSLRE